MNEGSIYTIIYFWHEKSITKHMRTFMYTIRLIILIRQTLKFSKWYDQPGKNEVRHEKIDLKIFVVVHSRAHPSLGMTLTFREYDL